VYLVEIIVQCAEMRRSGINARGAVEIISGLGRIAKHIAADALQQRHNCVGGGASAPSRGERRLIDVIGHRTVERSQGVLQVNQPGGNLAVEHVQASQAGHRSTGERLLEADDERQGVGSLWHAFQVAAQLEQVRAQQGDFGHVRGKLCSQQPLRLARVDAHFRRGEQRLAGALRFAAEEQVQRRQEAAWRRGDLQVVQRGRGRDQEADERLVGRVGIGQQIVEQGEGARPVAAFQVNADRL